MQKILPEGQKVAKLRREPFLRRGNKGETLWLEAGPKKKGNLEMET